MKVLLSAYVCEPNKGSEFAIGWNWALEIVQLGHEVWVLTHTNCRAAIEMELAKSPPVANLRFIYCDLPIWALWWRKGDRGFYLHYFLWQWGAYHLAKKIHQAEEFDRVHHITLGSIRQPSFIGNLGIPFIFGPVAGGERAPWRLRKSYGLRGWVMDGIRDLSNFLIRIDPLVRRTFKQAERICVTSEETLSILPRKFHQKAIVQLAIGLNSNDLAPLPEQGPPDHIAGRLFRILYVGRLLFWKGMHLGFPAFARLLEARPDAQFTIVGSGPDEQRWRTLVDKLGIGERIEWISWLDRQKLQALYPAHDVFLFPSLHDSGGMVVLEAMVYGLPVICLDLGGPGKMVDNECGRVISSAGKSESQVSSALAEALIELAENPVLQRELGIQAQRKVQEFTWTKPVVRLYGECKGSG